MSANRRPLPSVAQQSGAPTNAAAGQQLHRARSGSVSRQPSHGPVSGASRQIARGGSAEGAGNAATEGGDEVLAFFKECNASTQEGHPLLPASWVPPDRDEWERSLRAMNDQQLAAEISRLKDSVIAESEYESRAIARKHRADALLERELELLKSIRAELDRLDQAR
eukprot:TRINITY_DN3612_c0_g1_i2.p1 TRINITY_DN3612_c0_g1~~TRINITY_DN3612_c0_g1_i2.p1  ORF type:complete len:167 (-),score=27.71 TRINITY_DN3612_c0_g1_i2:493-993(-)